MDGYVFNGDELIDNIGRRIKISSFYIGGHGDIYFGTINGALFHATNTCKNKIQVICQQNKNNNFDFSLTSHFSSNSSSDSCICAIALRKNS